MTWRGREEALECHSIEEFVSYLRGLNFSSWRPSGIVLHNTASPTLDQWWNGGTSPEQRMKNLRDYYENDMGWSAGPHAFIDGQSWWIFTDFNVKGVHSPSWNGTRLGIEMVGDYDTESDESGMGAKVMDQTVALFGEVLGFFGWDCNGDIIKLHKEDPKTDHDCPGSNIDKDDFLDDVTNYMGDGGDHGDWPQLPRIGTVHGLAAGDKLNVRATASSSAPIIGSAENGDQLTITTEAWNGSTQWLRCQVGTNIGPDLALFGWVSAAYVDVAPGPGPTPDVWHENITATVFGNEGDEQETAYGGWVDGDTAGVSFPFKWRDGPPPSVVVKGPNGKEITASVIDVGPWNVDDPDYVHGTARPLVEAQYENGTAAQNGLVPSNDAGIDLAPMTAKACGISGKGKVSWRYA